nr:MAG TPA: hypothetical protein [Caudoviricetes sp.]
MLLLNRIVYLIHQLNQYNPPQYFQFLHHYLYNKQHDFLFLYLTD